VHTDGNNQQSSRNPKRQRVTVRVKTKHVTCATTNNIAAAAAASTLAVYNAFNGTGKTEKTTRVELETT